MILLIYSSKINVANYFLSLFIFIIGLTVLETHAQINGNSIYFAAFILVQFIPIYTLLGPCFYFHIRIFLYKKYRYSYFDFIQLIPALFLFINQWPYIIMPFSEKIMVAKLIQLNLNYLYTIPLAFFNLEKVILFNLSISLLYLLYGYVLFFKFSKSLSFNVLTTLERKRKVGWIFLFILSSTVMFGGVMLAMASIIKLTYYFYLSISGVGILFLIISLILFPAILYGREFIVEPVLSIKSPIKVIKIILLSQKQFIEIDTLVAVFMVDLPYTRNDFNLNKVSLELGMPKHHLTYYLHTHLNLSFNSWRDKLRIVYAKGLISKGGAQSLTLESIGKQAGFQSRDKFTRAFKAQTGSNPSDFLKNQ
jgi:AraC-like DNA-binding protein